MLWCYKKELYLSSHKKKRMRQLKKLAARGLLDADAEDPFSLFVAATDIRYCHYADSHRVLGNTFGMCVLQDFEALTPSLLARTLETVEGGGLVVLLLNQMDSLTRLYGLTMDVHARLRGAGTAGGAADDTLVPRFNERLVLALASSPAVLILDDELNVLPTSSHHHAAGGLALHRPSTPPPADPDAQELADLVASLADARPAGELVAKAKTLDQARALVTFLDAASDKSLRGTVALTAARGRGKSAALGLGIAGALALGYSNIFVTAPSADNVRTLFDFVTRGLAALGYAEHADFDLVEATGADLAGAVVRLNVYRTHRQTVQFVLPHHADRVAASAELLVIDEAAAIPLPLVRSLLGPYLVFLCSTVNGYEGTGRSLSLKLLAQLRAEAAGSGGGGVAVAQPAAAAASSPRTFREVTLADPIRYARGDGVEAWLHGVLCLDAGAHLPPPPPTLPPPGACSLYAVERDTLFSGHAAAEAFLQTAVSLLTASHYRNSPDDLVMLADAPAHRLFVLLGPASAAGGGGGGGGGGGLPPVLAVLQVALEGAVSAGAARAALAHGHAPAGDLVPWTVGQQFQDAGFTALSCARVVRLAVHPDLQRAGYGSRALDLLRSYYEGGLAGGALESEEEEEEEAAAAVVKAATKKGPSAPPTPGAAAAPSSTLHSERLAARRGLPPLLTSLADRPPEPIHYLSAAFGGTPSLFGFWRRAGYAPVYLRQTPSELTGEHTLIVLRELAGGGLGPHPPAPGWTEPFVCDFRRRAAALLSGPCRELAPGLALGLLSPRLSFSAAEVAAALSGGAAPVVHADGTPLTPHDLARLGAYASALADAALVGDLVPALAAAWVGGRLPVSLSPAQAALLVCVGLQRASPAVAASRLGLPAHQAMALFNKAIRRLHGHLAAAGAAAAGRDLNLAPALPAGPAKAARVAAALPALDPDDVGVDAELDAAAAAARAADAAEVAVALGGRDGMERFAVAAPAALLAASLGAAPLTSGAIVSFATDPAAKAAAAATAAPTPSTAMYKRGGDKKKGGRKSGGGGGGKKQ